MTDRLTRATGDRNKFGTWLISRHPPIHCNGLPRDRARRHAAIQVQQQRQPPDGVALARLKEELGRLGARYPVVSSNVELRRDGLPLSGRPEPHDPGVAVYFQLAGRPH